jgi:hypothetical protein
VDGVAMEPLEFHQVELVSKHPMSIVPALMCKSLDKYVAKKASKSNTANPNHRKTFNRSHQ